MATTVIPVEDHLRTTSEPDRDFVPGAQKEPAAAEWDHAEWQSAMQEADR